MKVKKCTKNISKYSKKLDKQSLCFSILLVIL